MPRSWLIVPLLILYLFDLGGSGFLGPDEPRYASIGREMARSHDVITPRLDGKPWFEKPPLLYWMVAAGRALRLRDEWAARAPMALLSVAFLAMFFGVLAREFSERVAFSATAILATSAGWAVYSFAAVPDLPMTVCLMMAMFIALFDTRREQGYTAGAWLGLAILAKGFVPVVLFAPLFLIARRKRLTMIAGCLLVAAPWHVWCWARNGNAFWQDYVWKQQVMRYFSDSLQHLQPFWFYAPVIVAGLFPWIPLALLLFRSKTYQDVRVGSLALWAAYTLLFFSIAKNKLPGYVLPVLPPLAIVFAVALDKAGGELKWWLSASVAMLIALPAIVAMLPDALLLGIRRAPASFSLGIPFVLMAPIVWWLAWRERPTLAMGLAALTIAIGIGYVKWKALPELDQRVSARGFWREHQSEIANACAGEELRREFLYGLNYYADRSIAVCGPFGEPGRPKLRITNQDGRLAIVQQ